MVERAYQTLGCALLGLKLETGRTHQIRVHLAAIGHPVIGDKVYGKVSTVESPRIFLHASAVEFTHPTRDERMRVESPLPGDLRGVLESLEGGE